MITTRAHLPIQQIMSAAGLEAAPIAPTINPMYLSPTSSLNNLPSNWKEELGCKLVELTPQANRKKPACNCGIYTTSPAEIGESICNSNTFRMGHTILGTGACSAQHAWRNYQLSVPCTALAVSPRAWKRYEDILDPYLEPYFEQDYLRDFKTIDNSRSSHVDVDEKHDEDGDWETKAFVTYYEDDEIDEALKWVAEYFSSQYTL